jgi:hypothetical protein
MGFFSKSKSSTAVTNTTENNYLDESANAGGEGSLAIGAGANVIFQDSDQATAARVIDLAQDVSDRGFDTIDATTAKVLDYLKTQSVEITAEKNRITDLSSNLALKSFDLADQKTTTPDENVLKFARIGLYVIGGLVALFLLFRSPKKA